MNRKELIYMPAPKGNQYAKGCETNGQPRKYTPDTLEDVFNDYITYCTDNNRLANIEGFCIFAKMDSQTYYNYKDMKDYFGSIKRIEEKLLDYTMQKGFEARNPAFTIFYMKNKFGWVDKTEIKQDINANINQIVVAPVVFDEE